MSKVIRVHVKPNYQLQVEFSDGVAGTVDLSTRLFGPMFEPLKDPAVFGQVRVDEFGAIAWPNGADLAPDALHETLLSRGQQLHPKASNS